jgi:broad specificity phosphatase PhoE
VRDETPVAVFTHGMFTKAVLWTLLTGVVTADQAGMRAFRYFFDHTSMPNTAVVALRFPAGGVPRLATGVTW